MTKRKQDTMPGVWVVSSKDKGRKKIYRTKKTNQRKVYLEDKEEFQIEIFNPTKENILSIIHLDGRPISKTGLIIRNGERIYLDCFIDDQKKFVFETYDVDGESSGVKGAIESNGNLEVSFFKEEVSEKYDIPNIIEKHHHHYYPSPYNPTINYPYYYDPYYYRSTNGNLTLGATAPSTKLSATNINSNTSTTSAHGTTFYNTQNSTLTSDVGTQFFETGKVGKGEKSNQKFKEVDMDFSKDILNEISIKLIPKSRKPKTKKDLPKSKNSIKLDSTDGSPQIDLSTDECNKISKKVDALNKLKELSDSGFISDKEIEKLKDEILNG